MKLKAVRPLFVDHIPEQLEVGALYISLRFKTAMHLCCCGCGEEVVTPLTPADWQLQREGNLVSLYPSIGNWGQPCKSHYWIRRNQIHWASMMSNAQIERVRKRDQRDKAMYISKMNKEKMAANAEVTEQKPSFSGRLRDFLKKWFSI